MMNKIIATIGAVAPSAIITASFMTGGLKSAIIADIAISAIIGIAILGLRIAMHSKEKSVEEVC